MGSGSAWKAQKYANLLLERLNKHKRNKKMSHLIEALFNKNLATDIESSSRINYK